MVNQPFRKWLRRSALMVGLVALPLVWLGCGGPGGGSATPPGADSTGTVYGGQVSGTVSDSRSTRESVSADAGTASQPLSAVSERARVSFETLDGAPLAGPDRRPFAALPLDQSGGFAADGLPLGVDFVIAVDLDGDGTPDIRQVVHIPVDAAGSAGSLTDVMVDPLSSLLVEWLRHLLIDAGVNPDDLSVSPTAIIHRVLDAYTHLFEETGIDDSVSLEDIASLDDATLQALFERLLPPAVRAGFEALSGTLALGHATEIEEAARAAAEVFIRSGFPIADGPGGVDLSFLADLPDVEVMSITDFGPQDHFVPEDLAMPSDGPGPAQLDPTLIGPDGVDGVLTGPFGGLIDDEAFTPGSGPMPGPGPMGPPPIDREPPTVYVSTVTEPDRNFVGDQDFEKGPDMHHLPVLSEPLLIRMAALHLQGRVITLGNLYRLLTDVDVGLGARLVYEIHEPGHYGPPVMVFETADGQGALRDLETFMYGLMLSGLGDPEADFDDLHAQEATIRQAMRELLDGTVPPTFERLFGGVLRNRIDGIEQLFRAIRRARAHLPFSRSGPATFFVIADGNRFESGDTTAVSPVTVDIEFDDRGAPILISHNPSGAGAYYLGFTHETDHEHIVEPIVIETGRWLHGPHGEPLRLDMDNAGLFQPVNGRLFVEFVSEAGTFFPGIPVTVNSPDFHFVPADGEPGIDTAAFGHDSDSTMQLFVLATEPGPEGLPVRVDFDVTAGTFTYNPEGRYYVIFVPETPVDGVFGLFDADLNIMPTVHDLTADRFVHTEPALPGDTMPGPDGTTPPPDGTTPPLDVTTDGVPGDSIPLDANTAGVGVNSNGAISPAEIISTDGLTAPDVGLPPNDMMILITPAQISGLDVRTEFFTFVFGTDAPNPNFDPDGNPYFDDANGNGTEDAGELTADFRPILFDPNDWRSTDVARYYRRQSGGAVSPEDIDWGSPVPQALDGEALVPRDYRPRLNAFAFGRPNSAINLLTTFLPPDFLDGTHALNRDTEVGIFQAVAMINLAMDRVFNVEGRIDIDGDGPMPQATMLVDAHLFVLPIGDPFVLLLEGFDQLSTVRAGP